MINIQDIIPFMRDGWVAMDKNGDWHRFIRKPYISAQEGTIVWSMRRSSPYNVKSLMFMKVAPADDWTKSLIKVGGNMIAEYLDGYFYNNGQPMTSFAGGVDSVLTPVPSYEEWQAKLEENAQLKKWCEEFNALEVAKENTKLKELLKGAKEIIEWYKADCGYKDTPTEVTLQHINQVLGEE